MRNPRPTSKRLNPVAAAMTDTVAGRDLPVMESLIGVILVALIMLMRTDSHPGGSEGPNATHVGWTAGTTASAPVSAAQVPDNALSDEQRNQVVADASEISRFGILGVEQAKEY
ncbi:MAG: hypothetical protein IT446_02500 [Phycisphaerales bacterium]|nr:hypothetical protein [Phycisphaerales bacterium]